MSKDIRSSQNFFPNQKYKSIFSIFYELCNSPKVLLYLGTNTMNNKIEYLHEHVYNTFI